MKRKFILGLTALCMVGLIAGCGKSTDTTEMDEQISSLIKSMGEEEISLDETKNSNFIVSEENEIEEAEELELTEDGKKILTPIPWEDIEVSLDDPELLTATEKLPQIDGYKFGMLSLAEEAPFPTEEIEYLGKKWMPIKVSSPKDIYGDSCSLYLSNIWDYTGEKASIYNEDYLNLLSDTVELFGEPIYSFNSDVVDLSELIDKGPISYMFKTSKYYLICYFEVNPADTGMLVTYYFLSTEVPHSEKNEKSLINLIREHDSHFAIKVYYETSEGNFVL